MERHLVIVPHTHWDREWYRTHEEFRYRLVALMDGLLELLEQDPGFRHFTLDGQTVVLDDYLEVRPEARARIERLVREGRLLIGPWYVLPDEWLVSGEALVRNLRLGLARASAFGGSMRLGYVPDQFGHVGQLPQIFAGFGFEGACLWRGVGEDVRETLFRWEAPDGTRLLTLYLIQGYGNASQLPLETPALAARLAATADALTAHSPIPSLLLMNGSDHVPPQPGLPAALEAASVRLEAASVEIGTLPGYFERARREAPEALAVHRGELRSGLRSPLLEGCASARLPQKRADFRNDRLLTRYLEPLAAWLGALAGDGDPGMLALAWRIALQNHPHDSICGCSVDAVHAQMDVRFARVEQLAGSHLRRVARELGQRVSAPPGGGSDPVLVAWNPHAAGRVVSEGELELDVASGRRAPSLHLQGADGRRVPLHVEVSRAGEVVARYELPARVVATLVRGFPEEFGGLVARGIREKGSEQEVEILLGAEPRAGFDFAAEREAVAARLERAGDAPVVYRARRVPTLRVRFADELPGHGLRAYRLARGRAGAGSELSGGRSRDGGAWIRNGAWRIDVAADGRVRCESLATGVVIEDALRLVSEADRGDEYTFDAVPGAPVVERPERVRVRPPTLSEAEAQLVIEARYRVPAALTRDRRARSRRQLALPARIALRLGAGLDRFDVEVGLDNTARDHRLRAHLRAPFAASVFEVESAFEVVRRPIAPAPDHFGSARPAELPTGATPQRSFATLQGGAHGFTVANRGLAEVEAVPEADGSTSLAISLLRAVGWLSRDDLTLRPGHAGPALETPGAQVPGRHAAELGVRLHAADDPRRTPEAHGFAAPGLIFAGGRAGGELHDGAQLLEVDDPAVVVSAIEPQPRGGALIRLYNDSASPRAVRVRWGGPGGAGLEAVDLAGRPVAGPAGDHDARGGTRLTLRPRQIASLRVAERSSRA